MSFITTLPEKFLSNPLSSKLDQQITVGSEQANEECWNRYRKDGLNEVRISDPCGKNSLCGVDRSAVTGQGRVIEDSMQKVGAVVCERVGTDIRVDRLVSRRVLEARSEQVGQGGVRNECDPADERLCSKGSLNELACSGIELPARS